MLKHIILLTLSLYFISCSNSRNLDQVLISYKEKKVDQSKFIKSLLHQGFLIYGKNLVLDLKNSETFEDLKDKTLEVELENLFIQHKADQKSIVIKDDELSAWIEGRTKGLLKSELEYFLNYSNMSLKEWKALFKNQLLKQKVLSTYKTEKTPLNEKEESLKSDSVKHYQIATLTFDSTIEAQNRYKELKAFPKRLDDLLMQKKGTKTYDWITEKDEIVYNKVKNLRQGGLTKPFESPWGHMIIKFFKSEKRPEINVESSQMKTAAISRSYLQELMDFKKDKDLSIEIRKINGLKLN